MASEYNAVVKEVLYDYYAKGRPKYELLTDDDDQHSHMVLHVPLPGAAGNKCKGKSKGK